MIWLALYIAAMFCIALPVAWFGKSYAAAAIFVTWSVGQIAYQTGMPEPQTQAVIYGLMFSWLCFQIFYQPDRWTWRDIVAVMLFLPLFVVCYSWSTAPVADPWWTIYYLAWAQVLLILRPKDWFAAVRGWRERHRESETDRFQLVAL